MKKSGVNPSTLRTDVPSSHHTLSCQLIHARPLKLASRNGLMRIQHRPVIVEGTHLRLNRRPWLLRTELERIEVIIMSTYSQQLRGSACFDHAALVEHH